MNIKFVELFCGIGGFRCGLEKSNRQLQEDTKVSGCGNSVGNKGEQSGQPKKWGNYTCVWANDNDKYACQIYRKQFGTKQLFKGDIRAVNLSAIPEHDLLTAGFPCQSFSIAGKRGGFADIRGTLFQEICRIAGAKRTPYLLLENVKGLLSAPYTEVVQNWGESDFDANGEPTASAIKKHKSITGTKGWVFLTILHSLWELGYDCQWQVLNSKDYGVPQNRERVFIIGHLGGQPRPKVFPIGEPNQPSEQVDERNGQVSPAIQVRDWRGQGKQLDNMMIIEGVQRDNQGANIGSILGSECASLPQIYDMYNKGLRANQELAGALKGEGVADTSLGTVLIAKALQTDGQLRQGVSWGTDKPQSARNIRRLTPLECERLQGFPDGWTEGISDTQRYKCLGNAVTVNVIEAIGRQWHRDRREILRDSHQVM